MCRPPLNKSHIDCFINACNKVQDNINLLLKYQDQFVQKRVSNFYSFLFPSWELINLYFHSFQKYIKQKFQLENCFKSKINSNH